MAYPIFHLKAEIGVLAREIPNFVRTVGPSKFRDQQIPPSPEVGG